MSTWKDELKEILPDRLLTEPADCERYQRDMVADRTLHRLPEAVVLPQSTEEVRNLMRLASRHRLPVTPRGGGSGLSGGAIAAPGGIVCSLERMDRVLEVDEENLMARLQPGVITRELDRRLEPLGLFFAGYPMSEEICTIGGNVATNAGGGRAVKYGVTAAHVLGLNVVTASGELLELGGKRLKDVTGLNLLPLFVGSEGTLGIITEITLRLTPRPSHRGVLLASFPAVDLATAAVGALRRGGAVGEAAGEVPSAIEYIDGATARGAAAELWRQGGGIVTAIASPAEAILLVEGEARSEGELASHLQRFSRAVSANGGKLLRGSDSELWKLRKAVPWWVKRQSGQWHSVEDVVVPPAEVGALVRRARTLAAKAQLPVAIFGHAGDGNFHINPMKPPQISEEEWEPILARFLTDLYQLARSLGGTISGEHGIGRKRRRYVADAIPASTLAAMQAVRLAFDPEGILNPGVLLP